jgi:hypothetical protein
MANSSFTNLPDQQLVCSWPKTIGMLIKICYNYYNSNSLHRTQAILISCHRTQVENNSPDLSLELQTWHAKCYICLSIHLLHVLILTSTDRF